MFVGYVHTNECISCRRVMFVCNVMYKQASSHPAHFIHEPTPLWNNCNSLSCLQMHFLPCILRISNSWRTQVHITVNRRILPSVFPLPHCGASCLRYRADLAKRSELFALIPFGSPLKRTEPWFFCITKRSEASPGLPSWSKARSAGPWFGSLRFAIWYGKSL